MLNKKLVVFFVSGGLGKNIVSTAVIENIKLAYPDRDIIVIASFPEVFLCNPSVKRTYRMGENSYLYEDVILGKDAIICNADPYLHTDYIYKRKHIIDSWCNLLNIDCSIKLPKIHLFANEEAEARQIMSQFQKPPILFQPIGGIQQNNDKQLDYYSAKLPAHKRDLDIEVATKVVSMLSDKYDVIQIKSPNQPKITGAHYLTSSYRTIFAMVPMANNIISIDSFLQHVAAAAETKAIVCWSGTSPDCLGYNIHKNIRIKACPSPECHRPSLALQDTLPNGKPWQCPYNEVCRQHNADEIVESILNTSKKEKNLLDD